MLKKIIILFVIFMGLSAFATDTMSDKISKLENAVLGVDYSTEKAENRLSRLEKNIYGKQKNGTVQSRLKNLNKDIAGDVIGEEIKPSKDTFMSEEDYVVSDKSEQYPIIDEIEQTLFKQNAPEKPLNKRLENIEKNLFNKAYNSDNYYNRMERIKSEYYSKYPPVAQNNYDDSYTSYSNDFSPQSYYTTPQARNFSRSYDSDGGEYNSFDENDVIALEQKVLRNTYPNDSINNRLSRLEAKIFDTDFFYDDDKIRIDRLLEATKSRYKRGKMKKFNGDRVQKGISTAISAASMILMILALIL